MVKNRELEVLFLFAKSSIVSNIFTNALYLKCKCYVYIKFWLYGRSVVIRKVLVDVDGTLLNLNEGARQVLGSKGIDFNYWNAKTYDLNGSIGCHKEDVYTAYKSVECYIKAPLYDGVLDGLDLLRKAGVEIHAYTACYSIEEIFNERVKLIKSLGMVGMPYIGGSKPILLGYDAVFDDHLDVVLNWVESDLTNTSVYLIEHSYNSYKTNKIPDSSKRSINLATNFNDAVRRFLC